MCNEGSAFGVSPTMPTQHEETDAIAQPSTASTPRVQDHPDPAQSSTTTVTVPDSQTRLRRYVLAADAVFRELLGLLPKVPADLVLARIYELHRVRAVGGDVDLEACAADLERLNTSLTHKAVQLLLQRGMRVASPTLQRTLGVTTNDLRRLEEELCSLPFIGSTAVDGRRARCEFWIIATRAAAARSFVGMS
jgi:hypothetical protein